MEHRVGLRRAHLRDHWNLTPCYHGSDFQWSLRCARRAMPRCCVASIPHRWRAQMSDTTAVDLRRAFTGRMAVLIVAGAVALVLAAVAQAAVPALASAANSQSFA